MRSGIYKIVSGFSRKFNLDPSALSKTIKGKRQSCKGWRVLN